MIEMSAWRLVELLNILVAQRGPFDSLRGAALWILAVLGHDPANWIRSRKELPRQTVANT